MYDIGTIVIFCPKYGESRRGQRAKIVLQDVHDDGSIAYGIEFADGHQMGVHSDELIRKE